ncbi:unnamed protein product [Cuscuta epithymum]|uniref:Uncharacterized protein n=1 Tax=Cuscuta epithymum TaxID=186058 RepID=A0AAV0E9R5_9ASTE|nr:unnamed protein product [Cuscuta epithymum]
MTCPFFLSFLLLSAAFFRPRATCRLMIAGVNCSAAELLCGRLLSLILSPFSSVETDGSTCPFLFGRPCEPQLPANFPLLVFVGRLLHLISFVYFVLFPSLYFVLFSLLRSLAAFVIFFCVFFSFFCLF